MTLGGEYAAVGWLRRHKNSARRQPCGTNRKEKEREMRNLFPPIIKQIDEKGKRMAKQKDGRYRAKITVGTDAI